MHCELLEQLGLSKNEARIYQTLLKEGESAVGKIAIKSKVHRRNVYDSLNRLVEKGLVFEILQRKENHYQAVDPHKLMELVEEKQNMLARVMPQLDALYKESPHTESISIYRGPEGWKNYMRDILRIEKPAYFIGAKGGWLDTRVKHFFPQFIKEARKKKLLFYHLFDYEVQKECPEILTYVGTQYRFLPKGFSTRVAIDIFGDNVNIISPIHIGGLDEEFSVTVIVNKYIADAFRIWFWFMWNASTKKAK